MVNNTENEPKCTILTRWHKKNNNFNKIIYNLVRVLEIINPTVSSKTNAKFFKLITNSLNQQVVSG